MTPNLQPYRYAWPDADFPAPWVPNGDGWCRGLPETHDELERDSRWPAFFPAAMCIVTTSDGELIALEKVVGPSIVNRFPYIAALSFCRSHLSARHHPRKRFMEMLERDGIAAIQFLHPGPALDKVMAAILGGPEAQTADRIARSGLAVRAGATNRSPVFEDAYLVYEGRLATPSDDIEGAPILPMPWRDVGSHRLYFLEVEAIQLREDIALGKSRIYWRSLPDWQPRRVGGFRAPSETTARDRSRFIKGYNPHYLFPSQETVGFAADYRQNGMAIKLMHRQPVGELRRLSNDEARWPCFFPSSAGMITAWTPDGTPTLLPCGSTTIVSRQPLVVMPCVSYANVNDRYARRASLELIRAAGTFGCGVPYLDTAVVNAITYAGNVSFAQDRDKVANAGVDVRRGTLAPLLPSLPVTFECKIMGTERLGTHEMLLGEVKRIIVRDDVSTDNPLSWYPWADVVDSDNS